jgi:hypothetical protein
MNWVRLSLSAMAASRFWMERSLMVIHRKLTKSKNILKFGIIRGKKVPL